MSLLIYAGSGQYLGCTLLAQGTALPQVALLTFLLNFRHLFYGLSLLDTFRDTGRKKPYLIFSLTDETYALMTSVHPPAGVDPGRFYLCIALLDHSYWILGSFIGAALGALITFDTTGIDFAMTALFVVIAVDQWKAAGRNGLKNHLPALLGFSCTILSCLIFGPDNLLIPALLAMSALLLLLRGRLEQTGEEVKA